MKRFSRLVPGMLLCLACLIPASSVGAHPSAKPELQFDLATHKLTVDAKHSVGDPSTHYVCKVEVFKDGKSVAVQEYKSQTDKAHQQVTLTLPDLKAGDEIKVKATCNKFGSRSANLTVTAPAPAEGAEKQPAAAK